MRWPLRGRLWAPPPQLASRRRKSGQRAGRQSSPPGSAHGGKCSISVRRSALSRASEPAALGSCCPCPRPVACITCMKGNSNRRGGRQIRTLPNANGWQAVLERVEWIETFFFSRTLCPSLSTSVHVSTCMQMQCAARVCSDDASLTWRTERTLLCLCSTQYLLRRPSVLH
jgi:hypothetical protein